MRKICNLLSHFPTLLNSILISLLCPIIFLPAVYKLLMLNSVHFTYSPVFVLFRLSLLPNYFLICLLWANQPPLRMIWICALRLSSFQTFVRATHLLPNSTSDTLVRAPAKLQPSSSPPPLWGGSCPKSYHCWDCVLPWWVIGV